MKVFMNCLRKYLLTSNKVRYVITGGSAFFVEYSCFALLLTATHMLLVANSISFIIGALFGFLMHKFWSFSGNHKLKTRHQLGAFITVAVFNFFVVNFLIAILVNHFRVNAYIAKVLVILLITLWNFIIFNRVIFKHSRGESAII